jgi:hypothetical protein
MSDVRQHDNPNRVYRLCSTMHGSEIDPEEGMSVAPRGILNFNHKKNSVAFIVRKRTIQTERPPLVGEVSANFCG